MKESMQTGVSIREFARQVDRSEGMIRKLIRQGKLPRNEDGSIPIKEGFKAYDTYAKGVQARKKTKTIEALPDNDEAPMSASLNKAMNVTEKFNTARMAEKTYQAKLKELEYRLKKGELVEREKVEVDAQATASLVRERLMSIPVRISGLCEGRTARDIEEILEDAINDVLKSFQKSEFIKDELDE